MRAAAHFDARRVAAIADELVAADRHAAAHTPEANRILVVGHYAITLAPLQAILAKPPEPGDGRRSSQLQRARKHRVADCRYHDIPVRRAIYCVTRRLLRSSVSSAVV